MNTLILDPSPVTAWHLCRQLAELGLAAQCVHDSESLFSAVEQGPPHLVFVELLQDQDNGFRVLRRLQAFQQCSAVLLSGTARATDQEWGLRAGASAVLRRPVDLAALDNTLAALGLWPGNG